MDADAGPAASGASCAVGPAGDSSAAMTKSQLFSAYKSAGPHKMYMDIMGDDDLRAAAEILTHVTRPLHEQYRNDLHSQKDGFDPMLEWAARRSLASTQETVIQIFQAQASRQLFQALRLPHCSPPVDYDLSLLHDDITITEKAVKFATHLSSNYGWSEMLHHYTLPLAATSLIARNRTDRERGMRHLKRLVNAIAAAEDAVHENASLQAVLADLAFPDEAMAREIMCLLLQANFSLDAVETQEVQEAMRKFCSGTSSTKELLESTFAHLSYCVSASNKNKVIAPSLLWLYCSSSPYVKESGLRQNIPTQQDWVRWISTYGNAKSEMMLRYNRSFQAAATPLPDAPDVQLPKTAKGIAKSKWRLAGPASHYKASAAAAFLMHDVRHNFQNCADAWSGVGHALPKKR